MTQENLTFIATGFEKLDIKLDDLAQDAYNAQKKYVPTLTIQDAQHALVKVLSKVEFQHAIMIALELDRLTNEGQIAQPLLNLLQKDAPNFGVDENIALGVAGIYGSIATTNYGYLDKAKTSTAQRLNALQRVGHSTVFIDDMISAIIASTEAKLAHAVDNTNDADIIGKYFTK